MLFRMTGIGLMECYTIHILYLIVFFSGPLLEHFGDNRVILAVLQNDNIPQAMALLQKSNSIQWTSFLPSQAQISPLLLKAPKQAFSLLKSIPYHPLTLDLLAQDPSYSAVLGGDTSHHHISTLNHALTMNIKIQGSFDDFWKSRSKNLRNNITRYFHRLKKNRKSYELIVTHKSDDIINALHRYGEMESCGWKAQKGTAITPNNTQGLFYSDVLRKFSHKSKACVYELYLNGTLAASRLTIRNNEMLIILKTTYNEELKIFSPGRLLLFLIIKDLFNANNIKHIEFYTNANKDQLSWASSSRWIEHATLYRNSFAKLSLQIASRMKHTLIKEMKLSHK